MGDRGGLPPPHDQLVVRRGRGRRHDPLAARIDRTLRGYGTYWWALGIGAAPVLGAYARLRSRVGLALTAKRDDETAARSLGVDVLRTEILVWVAAATGCGLAGAVSYLNLLRIQPDAVWLRGGIWGVVGRQFGVNLFPVQRRAPLRPPAARR